MRPHRGKYGNARVTKGGILPIYLIARCDFVVQGKTLIESLQSENMMETLDPKLEYKTSLEDAMQGNHSSCP